VDGFDEVIGWLRSVWYLHEMFAREECRHRVDEVDEEGTNVLSGSLKLLRKGVIISPL